MGLYTGQRGVAPRTGKYKWHWRAVLRVGAGQYREIGECIRSKRWREHRFLHEVGQMKATGLDNVPESTFGSRWTANDIHALCNCSDNAMLIAKLFTSFRLSTTWRRSRWTDAARTPRAPVSDSLGGQKVRLATRQI